MADSRTVDRQQPERPLTLYQTLVDLCENNIAHFEHDLSKHGRHIHASFVDLREQVGVATPVVSHLLGVVGEFDFDSETPANGYRSFLAVLDSCVVEAVSVGQEISDKRRTILFKKNVYSRKIDSCRHLLASLVVCLHQLAKLLSLSSNGELYADEAHAADFLRLTETLNMLPFYGHLIGFQFCKSMQKILRQISIGMASYNKFYESERNTLSKAAILVWSGGRYSRNPDKRAKKLAYVSQTASLEFVKAFWFTSEAAFAYRATSFVGPSIDVNKIFTIPTEPMELTTKDGRKIPIPIPTSHYGAEPIPAHLYSSVKRQGMGKTSGAPLAPPSPYLVFHCHGGGFVAQSPRSHEIYLREWACKLDMPIFSIDYSLAPKAPFPRPLEEVVYAYCWALRNAHLLGSTAEHVVCAGDSAGANLCLSLGLKCIALGLPPPRGLFLAYFPVLVSTAPSPSRILTFMDPMLPYGFLIACLKAYACPNITVAKDGNGTSKDVVKSVIEIEPLLTEKPTNGVTNGALKGAPDLKTRSDKPDVIDVDRLESKPQSEKTYIGLQNNGSTSSVESTQDYELSVPRDPFLSPWWATDEVLKQLPPINILSLHLDPCLDDCVMFARRLKRLDHPVTLDVLGGLPHGFLYFTKMSPEAQAGSDLCVKRIQELLGITCTRTSQQQKKKQ